MWEVLVCENCGLVHPKDVEKNRCIHRECGGKLFKVRIITNDNHETLTNHPPEPPDAN